MTLDDEGFPSILWHALWMIKPGLHRCSSWWPNSTGSSGTEHISSLDGHCNSALHRPVHFSWCRFIRRALIHAATCPIHLGCHLDTPKIFYGFLLWLGHIGCDLDILGMNWTLSMGSRNPTIISSQNLLVPLTLLSLNHQNQNNDLNGA